MKSNTELNWDNLLAEYMTTIDDIKRWLQNALDKNASHLIVATDTFDYSDYPIYVSKNENIEMIISNIKKKPMTRIMEIYNMTISLENQINEKRSWNI